MAIMRGSKHEYRCSFCGNSQEDGRRLIAGPNVYICGECVKLCIEIIGSEGEPSGKPSAGPNCSPAPPDPV